MQSLIELKNITKTFENNVILDNAGGPEYRHRHGALHLRDREHEKKKRRPSSLG